MQEPTMLLSARDIYLRNNVVSLLFYRERYENNKCIPTKV